MKSLVRLILVVGFGYALVMGLMTLQYFFDRGDIRRASEVIYNYRPTKDESKTLIQLMAEKLAIETNQIHCESQIVARYEGYVQVECGKQESYRPSADVNFLWQVDLVGARITAVNESAKNLMNQLTENPNDQNI